MEVSNSCPPLTEPVAPRLHVTHRRTVYVLHTATIIFIWVFLLFGAFMHLTNQFEDLRRQVPLVLLTLTTAGLIGAALSRTRSPLLILLWLSICGAAGFGLEVLGVTTHAVFGPYFYGKGLGPMAFEVPVVMALAWIKVILFGVALTHERIKQPFIGAFVGAFCIICYDIVLEPAAEILDYWYWMVPTPPPQNYGVWFITCFFFILVPYQLGLFTKPFPRWCIHLFIAEEVYFILIGASALGTVLS